MVRKNGWRAVFPILSLVCLIGLAPAAIARVLTAPNSPSAQNEWKGATTGLGSSHRFPDTASAVQHCGNTDPVVWSDGYHLTYYMPGSQNYGKTTGTYGFYACKSEADSAGFNPAQN
jgi:hypothetical protein